MTEKQVLAEFRRYWRRRRLVYVLKPVIWAATSIAIALAGSAALGDDGLLRCALWPRRTDMGGSRCDLIPGLSSVRSGRDRSGEGKFIARLLGIGLTERGSLSRLDGTCLWSPTPHARAAGSIEFIIEIDEVVRVLHRRLRWGATLLRVDRSDGSFVTLRGRDLKFAEVIGTDSVMGK